MRLRRLFLSACGSIALLCLFSYCMASCNGNGGSHDGGGPVYTPGAASSGSGSSESTGSTISADELLTLSNEGNTGAIISRFSGPNASTATTTVSFSSSVLGLPAGGYVTLVITGRGIAYTADATDPGSGTVSFTIPQIASGTEITVSIIVKKADGTVVCAGSKTQTVRQRKRHPGSADRRRPPDPARRDCGQRLSFDHYLRCRPLCRDSSRLADRDVQRCGPFCTAFRQHKL